MGEAGAGAAGEAAAYAGAAGAAAFLGRPRFLGAAGSGFSAGSIGLGALGGALVGVLGAAVVMNASKKKKEEDAA